MKERRPLLISWALTNRCNQRCLYCLVWKKKTVELTSRQVYGIIEDLANLGTVRICFTGGECFLREDFCKILDFVQKKNILVEISSNGALIKKKLSAIKDKKIHIICLSLDGPQKVHDYVRGKGSFRNVLEAFYVCCKNNISVAFRTVLSRYNISHIEFLLRLSEKFKVKIVFQPATALLYTSSLRNPFTPPVGEYRRVIRQLIKEKERGNEFIANSEEALRYLLRWPGPSKMPCISGKSFFHIEPDGEIYPCIWGKDIEKLPHRDCLKTGVRKAIQELPQSECEGCWNGATLDVNARCGFLRRGNLTGC